MSGVFVSVANKGLLNLLKHVWKQQHITREFDVRAVYLK